MLMPVRSGCVAAPGKVSVSYVNSSKSWHMQLDYMERVIQALQEVDGQQHSIDLFCLLFENMHVSCRGRMLFWKALPAQAKHCVSCVQPLLGVNRRGRQAPICFMQCLQQHHCTQILILTDFHRICRLCHRLALPRLVLLNKRTNRGQTN